MAAPSGIVWGSVVSGNTNSDSRIGIYTNVTNTVTESTVNVQVWVWTKYNIEDGYNSLYFNVGEDITAATTNLGSKAFVHTVGSGEGWSTSNQTKLHDVTYKYTRGSSAVTYKVYAKFADVDYVARTMYANTSYTVPALPSYAVKYDANGGSGAPSDQTKKHGTALTLSSTQPTRTGYTFQGWATSASGSVVYAAGASYTANAAVTLYAVWKANTYTVKFNANGGTGAPSNQTKTYGQTLKLSSTKPTRTNYNFLGWATSASATSATYVAGGNYTANTAVTLYAVWELAYVKPIIHGFTATRCDASGVESDDGTCARIKFSWECTYDVSGITIAWSSKSSGTGSSAVTASGKNGTVNQIVGNGALSADASYAITVTVKDSGGESTATTTLNGALFPIDFLAGGKGVAFGKPAEHEGIADFAFDAKFNNPVYGNVMGLNKLPEIPANSDLNDYMQTGSYAVYKNVNAATIANIPVARAGRLEVSSATGEGIRLTEWSYLRQKFIPYNKDNAVWERDITRSSDNVWTYGEWWKSSLTPDASNRVYHVQSVLWSGALYMNAGHSIDLTEKVTDQPIGIVLTFSKYADGAALENNYNHFFVPKEFVNSHKGYGNEFTMMDISFGQICHKYLYINNERISGHANNSATGTGSSGITYANNKYVLRFVYGV